MFQRNAEQRKQLHQIGSKSPFFTSAQPKSPIEVGYGESSGGKYEQPPRASRRRAGGGSSCGTFRLLVIWTALMGGFGYFWFIGVKLPQVRLEIREQEVGPAKHHWKQKVVTLEATLEDLENENQRLKGTSNKDSQTWLIQLDDVKSKLDREQESSNQWKEKANGLEVSTLQLKESTQQLQQAIQSFSRRSLLEKFGPGPHHVEVEVNFPTHQEENWYFTIELAPIDEMPHSIHTFLELVSRGLFDNGGYSFYSNAVHVIQGGPFSNHLTGSDIGNVEERFQESGYASVLFQEYSESFPHEKYTLGFTGRPGGPSFYINTRDNTQDHGPGGYAADGKGDPCFGKVIHGFDVVDKMHQASGEIIDGEWKHTDGGSIAVRSMKYMQ